MTPDELAQRRDWAAQVAEALARLPTEQRSVLHLCYAQHRSQRDIGADLHLPESAVRRLTATGLAQLAKLLLTR